MQNVYVYIVFVTEYILQKSTDLKWYEKISYIPSYSAGALRCYGIVLVNQCELVCDYHSQLFDISLHSSGQPEHPALHHTIHLKTTQTICSLGLCFICYIILNCLKGLMIHHFKKI